MELLLRYEDMHITNREKELLINITKGMTNSEIAAQMFITTHTVKAHIASLFRKFNAKSRLNLAIKAIYCGIIDFNDINLNNDIELKV